MIKKILAAAVAACLALTAVPALPLGDASAKAAESDVETLTGTVWWDAGNQRTKDYTLSGDGNLDLYVGYTAAVADGPAFSVELVSDTNKYITTGSDINIWTAEGATGNVEGGVMGGSIELGHLYKISISRSGADFTIVYFDVTGNKEHCTLKAVGTNMGTDVAVHVIAQVGTFMVGQSQFEMPEVQQPEPTQAPTPAPGGEAPGTNFAGIATQPVAGYTFDAADGIELGGEANVADGVLNLATKESHQESWAKIADLSAFDFSNGITLTADVKITGYISDWTPIFMLGDGALGSDAAGATFAYHFTQGFSSRADLSEQGYFGNGISAPYTWDWYSNTANQNRWDTIAVTIDKSNMATYINGVLVQSAEGDYSSILDGLKVAKNNYVGTSYWTADADLQGSLDNVGVYNQALPAADIAALTSAKGLDVAPGGDTPAVTTPKKTMTISSVKAKKGTKKITGKVSTAGASVTVKVGSAKYKAAAVNGKKFTFKASKKLKKGTKIKIKAVKDGYRDVVKTVKVK